MKTNNSLSISNATAGIYTDFEGLARLRSHAAQQSPKANREVAQQLESLFLQTMLKSMRQASQLSESADSEQTRFYQDMFDKQIAINLANSQGVGLADILSRQLGGSEVDNRPVNGVKSTGISGLHSYNGAKWNPPNERAFIFDLWSDATRIGSRLGVSPELIIAQSALETGWGRKIIKDENGKNSLNLFGIKADNNWEGRRVTVSTIEYRDGVAQQEKATFRSYASLSESMNDYADFLTDNPRYQLALGNAVDAKKFLHELEGAGYSTDPAYAKKIQSIMIRENFVEAVAAIRGFHESPEQESSEQGINYE